MICNPDLSKQFNGWKEVKVLKKFLGNLFNHIAKYMVIMCVIMGIACAGIFIACAIIFMFRLLIV